MIDSQKKYLQCEISTPHLYLVCVCRFELAVSQLNFNSSMRMTSMAAVEGTGRFDYITASIVRFRVVILQIPSGAHIKQVISCCPSQLRSDISDSVFLNRWINLNVARFSALNCKIYC